MRLEQRCRFRGRRTGFKPLEVANTINVLVDRLGYDAARDFCSAAKGDELLPSARKTIQLSENTSQQTTFSLEAIQEVAFPKDNFTGASWKAGVEAAKNVRSAFNISFSDTRGPDRIFERFMCNPDVLLNNSDDSDVPIDAIVTRQENMAFLSLLQTHVPKRRFATGRAIYLAATSGRKSRRLITDALMRDQQASRAFAAELLVPSEYLRSEAGYGSLSSEQVLEIAHTLKASPWVVRHQASNNAIQVSPS